MTVFDLRGTAVGDTSTAIKAPCLVATTAAITIAGVQTIDGVQVGNYSERVLVKDQADETTNGIYVAQTGNWVLAPDFGNNNNLVFGTQVLIASGTTNGNLTYILACHDNPIVIGSSLLTFVAAQGAAVSGSIGAYLAAPGPIGGTTPNAGHFTTLSVSGAASGAGFTNYFASPPAIGGTVPAGGAFTTLSASGAVSGAGLTAIFASPPSIGNTAPSSGTFTTLSASSVTGVGFSGYLASPPAIGGTAPAAGAFTALSASTVAGVGFSNYFASPPAIGSGVPAAGAFTTLSASSAASGAVSGVGFSNYLASPPAIGGSAPAAGAFTALSASGAVSGAGLTALFASPPVIGGTAPAAGTFTTVTAGTGAAITSTGIGGAIGTAAFATTGTSGATVPVLNAGATFSALTAVKFSSPSGAIAQVANAHVTAGDQCLQVGSGVNGSDSTSTLIAFYDGTITTSYGSITRSAVSQVAYNTTSDIRGKPNREPLSAEAARSIVDRLRIWDFDKPGNAIRGVGVIAQEAYAVHHSLAHRPDDPETWWSAEKAAPVPFLVRNVQNLNEQIDILHRVIYELRLEIKRLRR